MTSTHAPLADRETIDPELEGFVAAILAGLPGEPAPAAGDVKALRRLVERKREAWRAGGPAMQRREEHEARAGGRSVRVRLLDAGGPEARRPALIYLHGGGFALFSLDTHDRLMREYAARSGAIVIGVDYSLSPEAKFPTALEECVAVTDWLAEHAPALGIDASRVAIGGDSAGANLALSTCLMLRDRDQGAAPGGGLQIAAMLLAYGFFDADFDTPSQRRHGGPGKLLTSDELAEYLEHYLGGTPHREHPLALPARADLHDLPPSFHIIAECDPLADGDRAIAERLAAAGSRSEMRVYRGATHSFLEAVSVSSLAERALAESSAWLRAIFADVTAA